jgi:hypothetical protein
VEINRQDFFNEIFNTKVASQGIPPFSPISTVLHVIISKQDIHICQIFHNYSTITLPNVLKPKYSLSTRNKCVYLLEASETSITIWRQVYPKIVIFRMCYAGNGTVKFLETLADNVFTHNNSMMEIKKKELW